MRHPLLWGPGVLQGGEMRHPLLWGPGVLQGGEMRHPLPHFPLCTSPCSLTPLLLQARH